MGSPFLKRIGEVQYQKIPTYRSNLRVEIQGKVLPLTGLTTQVIPTV